MILAVKELVEVQNVPANAVWTAEGGTEGSAWVRGRWVGEGEAWRLAWRFRNSFRASAVSGSSYNRSSGC